MIMPIVASVSRVTCARAATMLNTWRLCLMPPARTAPPSTSSKFPRYFTYSNDGSADGRFLSNLALVIRRRRGDAEDVKLQLNVYDLTSEKYYSAIGTSNLVYSDPLSVANNTPQVGALRTIVGSFSLYFEAYSRRIRLR